jgi:uncharacterized membrane protein YjdF
LRIRKASCIAGGHYTYAEVPLFDGLFGTEKNNYDKAGHFFQDFVPAFLAREILIRKNVVNGEMKQMRHFRLHLEYTQRFVEGSPNQRRSMG